MTRLERPAGPRAVLEVSDPGLLTTVQDAGRPDHRDDGVPVAGACDPVGLAVANLVIGNASTDAALECTILGPGLVALVDVVIGLGGADLRARIEPGGRGLAPGRAHRLSAGDHIRFAGAASGDGCRAYLAVGGGVDVPDVLGSRSTSLVGAFGGFEGRPLRVGDRVVAGDPRRRVGRHLARWPGPSTPGPLDAPIRVLPAPGGSELAGASGDPDVPRSGVEGATLFDGGWQVASASDRRGLRLDGPPIRPAGEASASSHGVLPGTIQLTPSGQPLVLLNDGGTTGGYPVIGVVISADRWRLGQARPGSWLRFTPTDPSAATAAMADLRTWLASAEERLTTDAGDAWDDLADHAGG